MALPANVGSCRVKGRFMRAILDGPDPDREPDGIPLDDLTIVFTADLTPAVVRNQTAEPPVMILIDPITTHTNQDGVLVGDDGVEDILLIASNDPDLDPHGWTWKATISGPTFPRVPFSFVAPVDGVIDLSSAVPVPPSPGSALVAWQNAVTVTLENVVAAQTAQAAADAARDAAVVAQGAAEDAAAAATVPTVEQVEAVLTAEIADPESGLNNTFGTGAIATKIASSADPLAVAIQVAVDAGVNSSATTSKPPKFVRLGAVYSATAQNPVAGASAAPSIYFPSIIDARSVFGSAALDEFYMFFSTDHEPVHVNSGIWLATGPTELGPWSSRGRVYRDDTSGTQTETPDVFVDPTGEHELVMLYQQAGVSGAVGTQTTLWATSDDGVAWTRGGIAIDVPADWPSDGHTGYARVRNLGGVLLAHHLAGGFNWPTFGKSTSYDGRTWWMDIDPLSYQMDIVGDGRRIEWNSGDVILWGGTYWWIGMTSNFVSGADPKDGRVVVAPLDTNFRSIGGRPSVMLYPVVTPETTDYRSMKTITARDGSLILYYQCAGIFYAATTKGA
jgi:hypothetical protein